jgi:hypothetical protein
MRPKKPKRVVWISALSALITATAGLVILCIELVQALHSLASFLLEIAQVY